MPGVLDQRVGIGKEAVYGTAVDPTRHYEARSDPWQRAVERIDSGGFRQGRAAQRADRDSQVDVGAAGGIETAIFSAGMGLLLENLLGSATAPSQIGATGTYSSVFSADTDGPDHSLTVEVVRALGASVQAFEYSGCVPTGFTLGVNRGEAAMLNVQYDARAETKKAVPTAAAYTSGAVPFHWGDATVTVAGAAAGDFGSFSLQGDLALATDLQFLQGSALKEEPRRSGVPAYTGTISGMPTTADDYDRFVSGETFALVLELNNGGADATLRSFKVELAACKFTGSTPTAQVSGLTTIDLPFTAFHDGTSTPVKVTTISPDSSF